jgi:hypothetical protein
MPYYGQITGTDNGVEGSWFVDLEDDGIPGGWRDRWDDPGAAQAAVATGPARQVENRNGHVS